MARICEICGRIDEPEDEENKYDVMGVCTECMAQAVHTNERVNRRLNNGNELQ